MSIEARFRFRYKGFSLATELNVPARGVTALWGPSGCGKTTLLRAMAGLLAGVDGYFRVADEVWQDGRRGLPTHRRALAYVFQEASLFPHLSVRANLTYGMQRVPVGERRIAFDQVVSMMGLAPLLERGTLSLSGGERQRVAIGRALLASPRLLLMDEPLAALDRESKAEIFPFLERLHRELQIPVFYVSHAADEVARLADFLLVMAQGCIQASGPVGDMLTRLDLPLAYRSEAAAVIEVTVSGHDDRYHLTRLDFPGGCFTVPREALAIGSRVRLQVPARDVSITCEHQRGTSILNIFPVRVVALAEEGAARVMLRLDAGGIPLLSRVTLKSVKALGLVPGCRVFAQVKSVALLN